MCSRAQSREAREQLQVSDLNTSVVVNLSISSTLVLQHLYQVVESKGLILPSECPFSREHDAYLEQEQSKQVGSGVSWKCRYCGKQFKSEKYLDDHFDRKHPVVSTTWRSSCSACSLGLILRHWEFAWLIIVIYWPARLDCVEFAMQRKLKGVRWSVEERLTNAFHTIRPRMIWSRLTFVTLCSAIPWSRDLNVRQWSKLTQRSLEVSLGALSLVV